MLHFILRVSVTCMFFVAAIHGEDVVDLAQALKKLSVDAELFKPGVGAYKIRIIVQSDDYSVFDGTQLLARIQKINEEHGGAIINGTPEIIRFDPADPVISKDLDLSTHKTIFVAGWKPRFDKGETQSSDLVNFFRGITSYEGQERNFFCGYENVFKQADAVLVVLVCLENIPHNADVLSTELRNRLIRLVSNFYDDWYGSVALAFAPSPADDMTVFKVVDETLVSYGGGFSAWLQGGLLDSAAISKLASDELARIGQTEKDRKIAQEKWEREVKERKEKARAEDQAYEEKLLKARSFEYKKVPAVRLITTSVGTASQKVKDLLVNYGNTLFSGAPVVVEYKPGDISGKSADLFNQLDGLYKNIFVFPWDTSTKKSTLFFRADGYFSAYTSIEADKFSPVTTLLLFVPENAEAAQKIKDHKYVDSFYKGYCRGMGFDSCGGKIISVGYLVQDGSTLKTQVFGLEGVSTLADWLAYGVIA